MKKHTLVSVFFVSAALGLSACAVDHRIKTHPDPEVRIEMMRQTLEEIGGEEETSDQTKGQKGGIGDETDQTIDLD